MANSLFYRLDLTTSPRDTALGLAGGALVGGLLTAAAFLAPSLLTSSDIATLNRDVGLAVITAVVAAIVWYAGLLMLGLPVWVAADRRGARGAGTAILLGFAVPFITSMTWSVVTDLLGGGFTSASIDGVATVIDGHRTYAGWRNSVIFAVCLGMGGAVVGLVVWTIAYRTAEHRAADAVPAVRLFGRPVARKWVRRLGLVAASGAFVIMVGGWLAATAPPTDMSCHNMFRDGERTSIGSQFNMTVDLQVSEWPRLQRMLANYAGQRRLSVREHIVDEVDAHVMQISLCSETGPTISTSGMVFGSEREGNENRGMSISIFLPWAGTDWKDDAARLSGIIEKEWPGRVQYTGDTGSFITRQAALAGHSRPAEENEVRTAK